MIVLDRCLPWYDVNGPVLGRKLDNAVSDGCGDGCHGNGRRGISGYNDG